MPIPANWKPDPDDITPTFYIATQTLVGEAVRFIVNIKTGDFSIKSDTRGNVVTYNAKDDKVTYLNNDFKEKVQDDNIALSTINNIVPQRINEINKTLSQKADSGLDREEFLKGARYRRIEDTIAEETPDEGDTDPEIVNANDVTPVKAKTTQEKFEPLVYPKNRNTTQDYIQFTIGKYKPKDLKGGENVVTLSERPQTLTEIYGTISLPIQPSIVDSNSVAWNENELNPLQIALLKKGIDITENGVDVNRITDEVKEFLGEEKTATNVTKYAKLFLAQKAVGAQNLQSRFGGGIVNPNMELLFTGPQLRPFNFNFRLSPREEGEAKIVRKIIKTFKLSMAPKVSSGNAFLAAPSIFQIKYLRSDNKDHPSLNRIKLCALKSCDVDYTPENSYMTFKDASNTMVSYNLSLQFQELEPVYDQDYNSIKEEIGY